MIVTLTRRDADGNITRRTKEIANKGSFYNNVAKACGWDMAARSKDNALWYLSKKGYIKVEIKEK